MTPTRDSRRFDPAALEGLDEPVRRYLLHAIQPGAGVPSGMRLRMTGHIDVGRRLAFDADQEFRGHEFRWRARAGFGPFKPLRVVDVYRGGAGGTDGTVFGKVGFLHAHDADTARAAAGRAAAECIWVPGALLPGDDASWRAVDDHRLAVRLSVPPEHPEVTLEIDADGAVRRVSLQRWGDVGQPQFGYIPFGGEVHAERRFGEFTLPSEISVGWWFGTPRYKPFFEATILDATPIP